MTIKLPNDVLGVVIDILAWECQIRNDEESADALKAIALVARAYAPPVQRHLFASISLRSGKNCVNLASCFKSHPVLAGYVLRLHLSNDPVDRDFGRELETTVFLKQQDAAFIVSSASNLRHLSLGSDADDDRNYQSIPEHLERALRGRFRTIVSLHFIYIYHLPVKFIASCVNIKKLKILTPAGKMHYTKDSSFIPASAGYDELPICRLEVLDIDHRYAVEPFIARPSHHHPLKMLRVFEIPMKAVIKLLRGAGKSLEVLDIGSISERSTLPTFDVDLPSLTSIIFNGRIDVYLYFIAVILESECTPKVPRALTHLVINILATSASAAVEHEAWRRIDRALSQEHYSAFVRLEVSIDLFPGWNRHEEDVVKNSFFHSVAALNRKENVEVILHYSSQYQMET